jgi:hypothetical protein
VTEYGEVHDIVHSSLEGTVAAAQQHTDIVAVVVGDGEIGAAVAVEVVRGYRAGKKSRSEFTAGSNPAPGRADTV